MNRKLVYQAGLFMSDLPSSKWMKFVDGLLDQLAAAPTERDEAEECVTQSRKDIDALRRQRDEARADLANALYELHFPETPGAAAAEGCLACPYPDYCAGMGSCDIGARKLRDRVEELAVPVAPPEGNYACPGCGAIVGWEGEPPTDCLRCGLAPSEDEPGEEKT